MADASEGTLADEVHGTRREALLMAAVCSNLVLACISRSPEMANAAEVSLPETAQQKGGPWFQWFGPATKGQQGGGAVIDRAKQAASSFVNRAKQAGGDLFKKARQVGGTFPGTAQQTGETLVDKAQQTEGDLFEKAEKVQQAPSMPGYIIDTPLDERPETL